MRKDLIKNLFLLGLMSSLLIGCATLYTPEQQSQIKSIQVLTISNINKPYKILGQITAEENSLLTGLNYEDANEAIKKVAYERYGDEVDAIIGTVYTEKRGIISGDPMGTYVTGTAVKFLDE